MGLCYDKGWGVHQNSSEAFRLYKIAADGGDRNAQFNLAVYYEQGCSVPIDMKQMERWLLEVTGGAIFRAFRVASSQASRCMLRPMQPVACRTLAAMWAVGPCRQRAWARHWLSCGSVSISCRVPVSLLPCCTIA